MALGLWGGVVLALDASPISLSLAAILVVIAYLLPRLRLPLALVFTFMVVGATLILIRETGERIDVTQERIAFDVIARGDSDPLPIRVYGSNEQERSCSLRGESRRLSQSEREIPLRIITRDCTIFFGERLVGSGRLRQSDEGRVAATLIIDEIDSRSSAALWRSLDRIRKEFRRYFQARGDAGALVPGMVIGDTALQSDEFESVMRLAGLSHLTAVSGANFSIVATLVMWLVSLKIKQRRIRIAITTLVLLLFTILVRPSPSVLRAGVMAAVVLFAQLRGNQRSSLLALAGAVTLILLLDPYQGADAGFALSVLATFAIIVISPKISDTLVTRFAFPKVIADVVAIPVSATLLCTPIVIAISGKLTLASIPLNIIAAPLVPAVTILGFTALLLSPFTPLLADFLAWSSHLAAWPIAEISAWSYHLPIYEMPRGVLGSALYLAIVLAATFILRLRGRSGGWAILLLIILVLASGNFLTPRWQLYQCDVGQGDALLVNTGGSSAIVIDVGPDPNSIDRCLRKAGVDEISLLVVTHLHADHYGGIEGLLRGRKVKSWWLSNRGAVDFERSEQVDNLEKKIGRPAEIVESGMRFQIGQVLIDVLWPNPEPASAPRLAGDGSEENNRSIALVIEKDGARIFAGGDIEPVAQAEIARRNDLSRIDIYKVSHHGSHFRSAAFDDELNPSLALISVGVRNPYGHPAPATIDTLSPARIHRTDIDGPARITWWPLRIH